MSADCSTWTPMIGRPFSSGLCDRPDLDVPRRAAGAHREPHLLAGLVLRDQPPQVGRCLHRLAVDSDDHVGRLDLAVGRRVRRDGDDQSALRLGDDLVAELAQRDRSSDLLRAIHLPEVLAAALLIARARRDDRVLGDDVGAVGTGEWQELLEHRRLPNDHVDVEDLAGRMRLLALRPSRAGRAAWRCPEGGDSCRRGTATPRRQRSRRVRRPRADDPKGLHSRLRVSPPSTPMVVPETYPPRSDARKQTTSPTSRGVPRRRSGIVARSASVGPSG